jgi:chromosome segregation ATPase
MRPEKKEIEERKKELRKQHDDLLAKINEGKQAIKNMETNLIGLQGAIQQCDWTLELFKEEKKK